MLRNSEFLSPADVDFYSKIFNQPIIKHTPKTSTSLLKDLMKHHPTQTELHIKFYRLWDGNWICYAHLLCDGWIYIQSAIYRTKKTSKELVCYKLLYELSLYGIFPRTFNYHLSDTL